MMVAKSKMVSRLMGINCEGEKRQLSVRQKTKEKLCSEHISELSSSWQLATAWDD